MKAIQGSISCGIKRSWHLQLKWFSIKAEEKVWCWSWQAARSFPRTVRNYSHRLGFLKDFLLTKGRRGPEGEALVSMAEWAVVANFLPPPLFFLRFIYLMFWLWWVFVAALGLFLVAPSRGYSLVAVCGFLIAVILLLQKRSSSPQALVVVVQGLRYK